MVFLDLVSYNFALCYKRDRRFYFLSLSNFVYKVDSFAANTGYMKLDENIKECKKFSYSFNNYNRFFFENQM